MKVNGCALSRKYYCWLQWPNLFLRCITVYTLNSVHSNRITPSTTTTVLLAAFLRNLLPLLIPLRLPNGRCANLRVSRSSTRLLPSDRSQVQHPKKTLPPSLCLPAQLIFGCCVADRLVQTNLQQIDDTRSKQRVQ